MAQYQSRIYIQVTEPAVWERFRDADDAELELAQLAGEGETRFAFDEMSWEESELKDTVAALGATLGTDGIIIADTTNINTDPYAYIVWWAGHGARVKSRDMTEYCFDTDIGDLCSCLNYENNFSFNSGEMEVLARLGYERTKAGRGYLYRESLVNEGLEDELYLTETGLDGRTQRMEGVNPGDPVELKHQTKDKSYKNMVEVFCQSGSLGLLDEDAAAIMAPILDAGEKYFTAQVRRVLPLSKRAARYRSGLVTIHIQFCDPPAAAEAPAKAAAPADGAKAEAPAAKAPANGAAFTYSGIDGVDAAFYEGICADGGLVIPKDGSFTVEAEGKQVIIKCQTAKKMAEIQKKFAPFLTGKKTDKVFYDPEDAIHGHLEPVGFDDYGNQAFEVVGDAKTLTREQIAHRVQLFAKVNALLAEPAAAIKVVAAAPKKKNGTLYAKRVTQIATLPVMEQDTSMYVFCAVAKGDADLLVEIRKIQTPTLEKAENDVLSQTDPFRA
jgi:hypothetical protein